MRSQRTVIAIVRCHQCRSRVNTTEASSESGRFGASQERVRQVGNTCICLLERKAETSLAGKISNVVERMRRRSGLFCPTRKLKLYASRRQRHARSIGDVTMATSQ